MSKSYPFARFQNIMSAMRKNANDPAFDGCEEVLSFVAEKSLTNNKARLTDLVQSVQFGTGPTVHKKVGLLVERGFLTNHLSEDDKRSKELGLTAKGEEYLAERTKLMLQVIKEST